MKQALALVAFLSGHLAAQEPTTTPAEQQRQRAHVQLAQAVQTLEAAMRQIDAMREAAEKALEQAKVAANEADAAGLPQAALLVASLREQLSTFAQEADARRALLQDLRDQLAREVPAELTTVLGPQREAVLQAVKMRSLAEAETALAKLETELVKATADKAPGAGPLLSLVRYHLADNLRQQMVDNADAKNKLRENERLLKRSSAKFAEAAAGEDDATTDLGTSLRAAALRRIAQVEGALYLWNKELSRQHPSAQSYQRNAKKHRDAADAAFKDLQRNHAGARLADGREVVVAVREDIAALERQ